MDPVQHDAIVYSDAMSCLQAIEGEDSENPLICQIMNLWVLSDKSTCVWFWWVRSHCGIKGNEIVDQLTKGTLDCDIDTVTTVLYAELNPLVNSHIQQKVKIKWDVFLSGVLSGNIIVVSPVILAWKIPYTTLWVISSRLMALCRSYF